MERFLYLFLDLGAISIPFLFSFHPKIRLDRHWRAFWPAIAIVAVFFIAWDAAFTRMDVWGFNPQYLIGVDLLGLPIEEWLFFICIPYACVYTYFVFGLFAPDPWAPRVANTFTWLLIGVSVTLGFYNLEKWYTATTFILLAVTLGVLLFTNTTRYVGRFLACYAVLLIPFLLVNGTLTGYFTDTPVVWYNDAENLGIRMGTIPVEDTFYGMLMMLHNVVLFERWKK